MQDNKLDVLEFNMNRIDNYIEKADNKASFILAFNGIIIGIIFSKIDYIINFISSNEFSVGVFLFLLGVFLIFILSIVHALSVLFPRKSKDSEVYKSILYYKDISSMSLDEYKQKLEEIGSGEKLIQELSKQVREVSIICNKKMEHIRKSMFYFMISGSVTVILMILYTIQYIFVQ